MSEIDHAFHEWGRGKVQYVHPSQQVSILPTEAQVKRELRERIILKCLDQYGKGYDVQCVIDDAGKIIDWIEGEKQ